MAAVWLYEFGAVLEELFLIVYVLYNFWAAHQVEQFIFARPIKKLLQGNILIVDNVLQLRLGIKMSLCKLNAFWSWVDTCDWAHSQASQSLWEYSSSTPHIKNSQLRKRFTLALEKSLPNEINSDFIEMMQLCLWRIFTPPILKLGVKFNFFVSYTGTELSSQTEMGWSGSKKEHFYKIN